jgi:serine acetyltransferase
MKKKMSAFAIDKQKYYQIQLNTLTPSFFRKISLWTYNFGLQAVAVFRYGQFAQKLYARNRLLGFLPRLLHYPLHYFILLVYHININQDIEIGPGLFIAHGWNIVIGARKIGSNVSLTHNVTIGRGFSEGQEGRPIIGSNVWIGTGSIITGQIEIGDDTAISAGCILSRTVPARCTVAGNPGRVVLVDRDNSKYLQYRIPDQVLETLKE